MKGKTFTFFGLKILIFLLILFGIDKAVGSAFIAVKNRVLHVNSETIALRTPFIVEKVDADLLIIGSSKACHHYVSKMMADTLGITVYNCGQDGCYFLYQNAVVNMVLDRYKPKVIIWDIQPNAFYNAVEVDEYLHFRNMSPYYYTDNKWAQMYIKSNSLNLRLKMLSQMYAYNSETLDYFYPLVFEASSTELGYVPLPDGGYVYPSLKSESVENESHTLATDKLELLSQTIKRCKTQGIELYLFISPAYTSKSSKYKSAVKNIQYISLNNNIDCIDYSSNPDFMNDSTMFKDYGHLNDKGAKYYTQEILNELTILR